MEYVKEIFAEYNKNCIKIYQAYNRTIAEEAVALQTFGKNFNLNRMTWIKPSFLWMMYRSNWGTKKNQEFILALDIYQDKFNSLLEKAFDETNVYCQWDSDRNINGNAIPCSNLNRIKR